MESERDNTTDDQLLTVQEIAGLLRFRVLGIWAPSQTLHNRLPAYDSANTGALGPGRSWPGSQGIAAAGRRFDMAITLKIDTEKAGRAIPGGKMARRGFQQGSLFQRGTRKKVWVARWREDVIQTDGTIKRVRVSQEIGPVAQFPSRRLAMQVLSLKLASINNGTAKPQSLRTFASFVTEDWAPVVLPTLKYATQKHYRYMLDVHLIPAFGKTQLRDITREELQSFLSRNWQADCRGRPCITSNAD